MKHTRFCVLTAATAAVFLNFFPSPPAEAQVLSRDTIRYSGLAIRTNGNPLLGNQRVRFFISNADNQVLWDSGSDFCTNPVFFAVGFYEEIFGANPTNPIDADALGREDNLTLTIRSLNPNCQPTNQQFFPDKLSASVWAFESDVARAVREALDVLDDAGELNYSLRFPVTSPQVNDTFVVDSVTGREVQLKFAAGGSGGGTGPTGPAGPTGPQGPRGATGLQGQQGAQGPTGAAGAAGPTGAQGTAGAPGSTGPTGPTGSVNINGTTNQVIKFTDPTTGGNSIITDNGTNVGIGTTSPNARLAVAGHIAAVGPTPGVSNCGSTPTIEFGSNNVRGTVFPGQGSSVCQINFNPPFSSAPFCTVSQISGNEGFIAAVFQVTETFLLIVNHTRNWVPFADRVTWICIQ